MSVELSKEGQQKQKTLDEILKAPFKNDWKEILADALEADSYKDLSKFLQAKYAEKKIYPKAEDLFKAFELTSYDDVKVVILGQDPYLGKGHADGVLSRRRGGARGRRAAAAGVEVVATAASVAAAVAVGICRQDQAWSVGARQICRRLRGRGSGCDGRICRRISGRISLADLRRSA